MTRLNAASVFVSRRIRLLVMAAVVIGCLKAGLSTGHIPETVSRPQSSPIHAGVDIKRDSNAERTQSPDNP